ncbi:hypothetical protein [Terrisporobacter sp.]
MENALCNDKRLYVLLQFYGVTRTGRWAGKLVQVQNLPKNHLENLDELREMVKNEEFEKIENLDVSTSEILSQLIRTSFVPKRTKR